MPGDGDSPLVAIRLPLAEAVAAIVACWDAGEAVLPIDPDAPDAAVARTLEELRPTEMLDGAGRRPLTPGVGIEPDVAAVVATSGTEGEPRGVELTWSGMRASAEAVSAALGVTPDDNWLCCLPVHHVGGLAVVARSWATGTRLTVSPWRDASRSPTAATLISIVPTLLVRAVDDSIGAAWLGGFRRVLVGGAMLDRQVRRRAEEAGIRAVSTYGLTETWGGVVHDGHPLRGIELRLSPDGEIEVRGPMVMKGYRNRPGDTAAAFTGEGWLRTGDAGVIDPDGRLTAVDRLRDLVVTGGVTVSPAEVEAVLIRHPAVADAGVTGRPDPEWGEVVVAHVVPTESSPPPSLAELRAFAAGHLAAPKLPKRLELVAFIPRTSGGKPMRRLLR